MGILKAASVFSDHMVLQKGKPIRIWGMDRDGNQVTVSIRRPKTADVGPESAKVAAGIPEKSITVPVVDHQWSAVLAPIMEYGGPYEVIITNRLQDTSGTLDGNTADSPACAADRSGMDEPACAADESGTGEPACAADGSRTGEPACAADESGTGEPACAADESGMDESDVVRFADVWIGEVWLAGGQSNMEFELKDCRTGKTELEQIKESGRKVRFYYTKKISWMDEYFFEEERRSQWETCEDEGVVQWSAVGYYFAKRLAERLNCMVGVIGCNWGGTSAAAWISREWLASDSHTVSYLEEYDKAMEGKSFEQYLADLEAYRKWEREWQPKIDEFYRNNPTGTWDEALAYAGDSLWPEPLGPKSPFRPGGLYETMLKRVCPYTLAGFLYYQGEADEYKPTDYECLFSMLIRQWRHDWMDPKLPFLCVQLPMFLEFGAPERKNWCLIREAQMRVQQQTAHMGIAVILDKGEFGNIHPIEKETVGERLALQALEKVYGIAEASEANGPVFRCAYPLIIDMMQRREGVSADSDSERDMQQKDGETVKSAAFVQRLQRNAVSAMCVEFDYADGMYVMDPDGTRRTAGPVDFFELADADGAYVPAEAELCTDGRVLVHADAAAFPTRVRFQWVSYGDVTLFGANGIPAAPFRSDYDG